MNKTKTRRDVFSYILAGILLLSVFVFFSCKHSAEPLIINHTPSPPDTVATGCDTTNVTYSKIITPVLQLYCVGCHSGAAPSGGVTLATYNDVLIQVNNGKLMGSIQWLPGYFAMPKNGNKLSNCQIAEFRIWVQAGAPNN